MLNQIKLYQLSFHNEYFFILFLHILRTLYLISKIHVCILCIGWSFHGTRCAPYSDEGRCGEENPPPVGLKQKRFSFLSNKKISTEVVHFFRYFSITEIIYRNIMIHNVNAPNTHTQPTGQTPTKLKKVLLHPSDHTPTTNRHQPQMLLNFLLNVRLKIAWNDMHLGGAFENNEKNITFLSNRLYLNLKSCFTFLGPEPF